MKLPTQKKILREELKDAPAWVNGIIDPVNSFMESVYVALNRNITVSENIASFVKEITYSTTASYPVGVQNIEFLNALRTKPVGLILLQVYDKANYVPPPGPVFIPWVEDTGSIIIYPITGLEASKNYLIRMLIL